MIRKMLAAAALAVLPLGGILANAAPASAATAVSACFQWDRGAAYANQPVKLMQWNGSGWATIRSGYTNSSGCGTFYNVPSGAYTSMRALTTIGSAAMGFAYYQSAINNWATPGTGGVNLGWKTVNLVQCSQGSVGYCGGMR